MRLLDLLRRESTVSLRGLTIMAMLAGISSALVLPIINTAAALASTRENSLRLLLLFALVVSIFAVSQSSFMLRAVSEVERALDRVRTRLANKIRRCDLGPLEQIGRTAIYNSITKDTTTISRAALMLVVCVQAAITIVFTAVYVLLLSPLAFFMTVASTVAIGFAYRWKLKQIHVQLQESLQRENELFDSLTHLLDGFKEVRLNRDRSDDLFARFSEISHSVTDLKTTSMTQIARTFVLSQVWFYLLLGVIVFLVPRLTETYTSDIVKITTAVLFLIGPITSLMNSAQSLAAADAAVENIDRIEAMLDRSLGAAVENVESVRSFQTISFDDVVFRYAGEAGESFTVGPIDLTIRSGEVLFIAGGNGSGKSTFLKLLTALYFPSEGTIRVDGIPVAEENYESYRTLFSTVFTDFHLFPRLYGLEDVPQETIDRELRTIELEDKTRVVDSTFETLDLSGGQRKRLSLLVSLLEDRPVCIFDEVAADQDPTFRRKFYQELLPRLKREGKTVVAVTHDDRYFADADRLLKMDEGRLRAYDHA